MVKHGQREYDFFFLLLLHETLQLSVVSFPSPSMPDGDDDNYNYNEYKNAKD